MKTYKSIKHAFNLPYNEDNILFCFLCVFFLQFKNVVHSFLKIGSFELNIRFFASVIHHVSGINQQYRPAEASLFLGPSPNVFLDSVRDYRCNNITL